MNYFGGNIMMYDTAIFEFLKAFIEVGCVSASIIISTGLEEEDAPNFFLGCVWKLPAAQDAIKFFPKQNGRL